MLNTALDLRIAATPEALAEAVAQAFLAAAAETLRHQPHFSAALAGGNTPRAVYARLARPELAHQADWAHIHLFWGDERCVPPDHPESNYRMARETLLDHIPLPTANVHRLKAELDPPVAAATYTGELRTSFGDCLPRFDWVLLGLGEDGHTASLFPGTAAVHERERWVLTHWVPKLHQWRLTLTPPVFNNAAQVTFLVSGENKRQILHDVLTGDYQPDLWPAQSVKLSQGQLTWQVDAAAGALLV